MRILKGWTDEEQKELEDAKDNGFNNAIDLIKGIVESYDDCIYLSGKYSAESSDEDNQLARDIADYYNGEAKFPDRTQQSLIGNDKKIVNAVQFDSWDEEMMSRIGVYDYDYGIYLIDINGLRVFLSQGDWIVTYQDGSQFVIPDEDWKAKK